MLQGFLRLNSDTFRENSSELGVTRLAWRLKITKIIRETTDAFKIWISSKTDGREIKSL